MENVKKQFQKIFYLFLLMLFSCLNVSAQRGATVRGTVVDDSGEPVIGASVVVKGSKSVGTVSDLNGDFVLTVPSEKSILIVSFIGMSSQEVKITGKGKITVVLKDDSQILQEVVVVGYGQQKKASVVGAITQTSAKVL